MDISSYLMFNVLNGVATIGVVAGFKVKIIGKTMNVGLYEGKTDFVRAFSLELTNEEKVGVLALAIRPDKKNECLCAFVDVRALKDQEKIWIDLDEYFVPAPGRLAFIDNDERITVAVGETIYTNKYPDDLENAHPEYRLVDPDNLCRYIVELIDAHQLENASTSFIAALTELEIFEEKEGRIEELERILVEEKRANWEDREAREKSFNELLAEYESLIENLRKFGNHVLAGKIFISDNIRKAFWSLLPEDQKNGVPENITA